MLHAQAAGGCLVPPMGFGTAAKVQAYADATEGNNQKWDKTECFSHQTELSGGKFWEVLGENSSSTVDFSYSINNGIATIDASVMARGHTENNHSGTGRGFVDVWLWWVDLFTLKSATTKPLPKAGEQVDSSQIVTLQFIVLKDGQLCTGAQPYFEYRSKVLVMAEGAANKQVMGGHLNTGFKFIDSDCADAEFNGETVQTLLGIGRIRVQVASNVMIFGVAEHGEGHPEHGSVRLKLDGYRFCYNVVQGPKDLEIASESGLLYACKDHGPKAP
jgi:hypothetical protein